MLPSGNRRPKDKLKTLGESGESTGSSHLTTISPLTPNCWRTSRIRTPSSNPLASGAAASRIHSGTLRRLRPLIILDEAQKGYSVKTKATLEEFDPCVIIELLASLAKGANVLVEILGPLEPASLADP